MSIKIKKINGERCVYQHGQLIANIYDHRRRAKRDQYNTIRDDWMVAWVSGRCDWHGTYEEAKDNALKGATSKVLG